MLGALETGKKEHQSPLEGVNKRKHKSRSDISGDS